MSLPSIQEILYKYLDKLRQEREKAPSLLEGQLHTNASSAGACARAIGYKVAGVKSSEVLGLESLVNFYLGDCLHDVIQRAIQAYYADAQIEVSGQVDNLTTFRADAVYPAEDGQQVTNEIKSISDFGFEKATGVALKSNGRWKKKVPDPPEGAKPEHILQAGITARGLQSPYLTITYVRKTAAKDEPVTHEWRYKAEDFKEPIDLEIERHRRIVELVSGGRLPEREYEGKIIDNPSSVKYPCGYCDFYTNCLRAGAGIISITPSDTSSTVAPDTKETPCEDLKNVTPTETLFS